MTVLSTHTTATAPPDADTEGARRGTVWKLPAILLGLTALVTLMLSAFALPNVHSGPHQVPVGVSGPQAATQGLQKALDGDEWDVRVYDDARALTSAVKERKVAGGLAVSLGGIDVYTATAGAPSASTALTALGDGVAAKQHTEATTHELAAFPAEDPHGSGLAAAALPMIFGGIFPAVILSRLYPGHAGLRVRLGGVVLFALLAGFAVTALLQFGTGSLAGDYWVTSFGMSLGMAALSLTFIGLEALVGMVGLGLGAAVMMFLGNPLSGLATGPYWLPSGWSTLGQLLPPGASGSLLRANAFFDGSGAGGPALVLVGWVVFGLALILLADRLGNRRVKSESWAERSGSGDGPGGHDGAAGAVQGAAPSR